MDGRRDFRSKRESVVKDNLHMILWRSLSFLTRFDMFSSFGRAFWGDRVCATLIANDSFCLCVNAYRLLTNTLVIQPYICDKHRIIVFKCGNGGRLTRIYLSKRPCLPNWLCIVDLKSTSRVYRPVGRLKSSTESANN